MSILANWQRLLQSLDVKSAGLVIDGALKQKSMFFRLPTELRLAIYEYVLVDSNDSRPAIVRLPAGEYTVQLHRPPSFSHLLLACRDIYAGAVCVLWVCQTFDVQIVNQHMLEKRRRTVHRSRDCELLLSLPRRIDISVTLNDSTGVTSQLVILQSILTARQSSSRVSLSLEMVSPKKKFAIVKALRVFLAGCNASLELLDWSEASMQLTETDFTDLFAGLKLI